MTNPYVAPRQNAELADVVGYKDPGWPGPLASALMAAGAALDVVVPVLAFTGRVTILLALQPYLRLAGIAGAVALLIWLRRILSNAHAFGHDGLSFRSVRRLFVPLLNLVWTYQMVSEIWRASEAADAGATPRSWVSNPSPDIIKVWWGTFLGCNLLAQFGAHDTSPSPVAFSASVALSVVSAICGVVMVRRLDDRQRRFAEARARGAVWGTERAQRTSSRRARERAR